MRKQARIYGGAESTQAMILWIIALIVSKYYNLFAIFELKVSISVINSTQTVFCT